ncbi:MAG: alanine--tRNA ligase-related protein [Candidatus Woesearchaeota archaeon]|nr:alanine--tRNA ligase-related protein [Candidatus Woesearchaeota archaeon]
MKRELFEIYDSGITELDASVKSVSEENGAVLIILDKTPFRPASGGQPTDFGIIENESFSAKVIDAVEKEGEVIHRCEVAKGRVSPGDKVAAKIDGKRRKNLMLMHSGEHLFFSCLKKISEKEKKQIEVEKVNLSEEESNLFVKADSLNWYSIFQAEELANSIIDEEREVKVRYAEKKNIEHFIEKGLRIKKERIAEDFVRVVEFSGIDLSACTGTHVKNTSEIKGIVATDFKNRGNGKFEIKFKAGLSSKPELFSESRIFRKIETLLCASGEDAFALIMKLIEEKNELKEKYHKILLESLLRLEPEKINGIKFYFAVLSDAEQKVLTKAASVLSQDKSLVSFINQREDGKINIMFMASKNLKADVLSFMNSEILSKFAGKGGGSENYSVAEIECPNERIPEIELKIRDFAESL